MTKELTEKTEGAVGGDLVTLDDKTLETLVVSGDLAKLTPAQRLLYYRARCQAAGLDPRTAPFNYMSLQGKLVLYAHKGATDQLTANNKIRTVVLSQATEGNIRIVMVRATAADGRATDEMGAVPVAGLELDKLANAYMKAITKAKRRAILSLCGLGMMDETEIETTNGRPVSDPIAMPTPIGPATPPQADPAPTGDGQDDDIEVLRKRFARAIAEKGGDGTTIYTAFDTTGKSYRIADRAVALKIKASIEAKTDLSVEVMAPDTIVSAENAPVA